jgi:hypothetical protein
VLKESKQTCYQLQIPHNNKKKKLQYIIATILGKKVHVHNRNTTNGMELLMAKASPPLVPLST